MNTPHIQQKKKKKTDELLETWTSLKEKLLTKLNLYSLVDYRKKEVELENKINEIEKQIELKKRGYWEVAHSYDRLSAKSTVSTDESEEEEEDCDENLFSKEPTVYKPWNSMRLTPQQEREIEPLEKACGSFHQQLKEVRLVIDTLTGQQKTEPNLKKLY